MSLIESSAPLPGDPRAAATPAGAGFVRSGKVRDLFDLGDRLLLVASDRLSAFDVVLPTAIPDKGRVLTGLSRFWFGLTQDIIDNHLLATDPSTLPAGWADPVALAELRGRIMVARKARVLPIEVIVRGYVSGSGWKDYRQTGAICGIKLPAGLRESDRLPEPIFTPSTKAEVGHDENIDFDRVVELIGGDLAEQVRDVAIRLYNRGAQRTEQAGILLADTKFEFGIVDDAAVPSPAFAEGEDATRGFGAGEDATSAFGAAEPPKQSAKGRLPKQQLAGATRAFAEGEPRKQFAAGELPKQQLAGATRAFAEGEPRKQFAAGELLLIDEVLTPDSSRFWPKDQYEPGRSQSSFDKQPVRDWLESQPWDKTYPAPELPAEIVADTRRRYVTAFERITGASFERYLEEDVIAP